MTALALVPINPAALGNTAFSSKLPGMQLAVDSTSLGEAKVCARRYYYSIGRGVAPRGGNVHLQFGIWMHQVRERYEHHKMVDLLGHEEALDRVLDWALRVTWNETLNRPWISGHDLKTRQALIQTAVWYLDKFGRDDPFETIMLANGKPAIELSFRFDSGLRTQDNETIMLCGHIDRIALLNSTAYVKDIKTASTDPSVNWAKQFTPGNQFSLYTIAGKVALATPTEGVIVDGIQLGVNFSRFQSHLIPRDAAMLEEWMDDAAYWIGQMESWAAAQHWPMNDQACKLWGGCPFQALCARTPGAREAWIGQEYESRVWDPLRIRGDI